MPNVPSCNTPLIEREAIGAICFDAGIAANMFYAPWGSGTYIDDARRALIDVFEYSNAIEGCYDVNSTKNIPRETMEKMVNPSLDAGSPVFFGIRDEQELRGLFDRCYTLIDAEGKKFHEALAEMSKLILAKIYEEQSS